MGKVTCPLEVICVVADFVALQYLCLGPAGRQRWTAVVLLKNIARELALPTAGCWLPLWILAAMPH